MEHSLVLSFRTWKSDVSRAHTLNVKASYSTASLISHAENLATHLSGFQMPEYLGLSRLRALIIRQCQHAYCPLICCGCCPAPPKIYPNLNEKYLVYLNFLVCWRDCWVTQWCPSGVRGKTYRSSTLYQELRRPYAVGTRILCRCNNERHKNYHPCRHHHRHRLADAGVLLFQCLVILAAHIEQQHHVGFNRKNVSASCYFAPTTRCCLYRWFEGGHQLRFGETQRAPLIRIIPAIGTTSKEFAFSSCRYGCLSYVFLRNPMRNLSRRSRFFVVPLSEGDITL